jgi:hypothetical protein
MERGDAAGQRKNGAGFGGGELAVEDGDVVDEAGVVEAESKGALLGGPSEGVRPAGGGADGLAVEVEGAAAVGLAGVEIRESDEDVRPALAGKHGAAHEDHGTLGVGHLFEFFVLGIPEFRNGKNAVAKVARVVVFGEFDEEGALGPFLADELERVAVAGGEVAVGVEFQPEGNAAGPRAGAVAEIFGTAVENLLFGFAAEFEGAAVAAGGGDEAGEFFGGEAGRCRGAFAAVEGGEDAGLAAGEVGVGAAIEGRVEGERGAEIFDSRFLIFDFGGARGGRERSR